MMDKKMMKTLAASLARTRLTAPYKRPNDPTAQTRLFDCERNRRRVHRRAIQLISLVQPFQRCSPPPANDD